MKVLLGGWNIWKESNARDAAAYPIENTFAAAGASPTTGVPANKQVIVINPQGLPTAVFTPTP